ncbi:hypothetical protein PTI98_009999 [Pleurotus ostreatus]|nr:hypothetical protein PTI98_009999 [Pleurotus ostreatus]
MGMQHNFSIWDLLFRFAILWETQALEYTNELHFRYMPSGRLITSGLPVLHIAYNAAALGYNGRTCILGI